jgi:GT2 family glycosyltransferase
MVTHNSLGDLQRHLRDHVEVAERLDVPLVVVDNASLDRTVDFLRGAAARSTAVALIALTRNLGYAAAVNHAFAHAGERDVLLLNPDVELRDTAPVQTLVDFLTDHPRVAAAAPRLLYPDGTPQPSVRRFPSLPALVGSLRAARRLGPARRSYESYLAPSTSSRACVVDWVLGAAMLIRRRAFDAVGGWDERFFLYMEDADFCRRCGKAGWKVAFVPEVNLRHEYARASTADHASVLTSGARRRHIASLARFFWRHPELLVGRA